MVSDFETVNEEGSDHMRCIEVFSGTYIVFIIAICLTEMHFETRPSFEYSYLLKPIPGTMENILV